MRLATITTLTILLLSLAVWAAPNTGGGTSRSGGGGGSALAAVDEQVLFTPSTTTGEAPLAVGFTIQIYGTSLGSATWFYVLCNDDGGNILPNTGIVALQSQNAYSSTYVTDGFCIYESAGAKTARLWYSYRDTAIALVDADITVTEPVGSIDVQLGVEPLVSTETTDIVMTATVTGEAGEATSDTECKFWNDHAAAVAFADVDNDDVDDPVLAPGAGAADTGVAVYADYVGATVGERTAAVACQRNGQEDTAHVPYTILADTITPIAFFASPATGNDPLAGVELEASVTTTCLNTDNITFQFDCLNDAVFEHSSGAVAISTLIDEDGVVTYNTQNDGAFDCANFTPANTYTAALTVDCGTAVQATRTTEVLVKADPTFSFNAYVEPSGGVEPLDDVQVWIDGWGGTATGDVTIDAVSCDTSGADTYTSPGDITDPTGSVNLINTGTDINCDYATDAVYTGDVDATRGTVSFTDTFTVNVTPRPTPPIFQLSETSFNRMALAGEDADDVVFTVGNVGGGNLEWDEDPVGAGESEAWLSCTPDAAVMNATAGPANGESEEITCTITSSTLGTGSYEATVTYTDPAATPTSPDTPVTVYLTVSPVSTPIHLEVDTNLTAGPSPLAVDFSTVEASFGTDYTGSTWHETSTIDPFSDIYYEWDFGDDDFNGLDCQGTDSGNLGCRWSAITTANGANAGHLLSRNYMTGPLGAHVYEPTVFDDTCGVVACHIYYPSLRATDEDDNVVSWNGTVSVYDPDSEGANGWGDASETVCISKVGDFTGCPFPDDGGTPGALEAEHLTSSAKVQTLLETWYDTNNYRRILFHAGESWDFDGNYTSDDADTQPGLIGSYGTANDSRAMWEHSGNSTFPGRFAIRPDNLRIQDIEHIGSLSGAIKHYPIFKLNGGSTAVVRNLLIQRNTTPDDVMTTFFDGNVYTQPAGVDSTVHNHLFFVDNDLGDLIQQYAKQFYVYGNSINILGNVLGAAEWSHTIRPGGVRKLLISNNLIGGAWGNAISIRDLAYIGSSGCCFGRPYCNKSTKHLVISDNDIHGFSGATALGGTGPECDGTSTTPLLSTDYVIERNYVYYPDGGSSNGGAINIDEYHIGDTLSRISIRNNVIDTSGSSSTSTGISVAPGVSVLNNTCYNSGGVNVYCVEADGATPAMDECRNNVLWAPTASGTVDVTRGTCTASSTNFDNGVTGGIATNPFISATPDARWKFWPKDTDTQIRNQGTAVPTIFDDAINTCRQVPLGGIDVGALEYPYAAGDGAVDGVPGCR